MSSTKYIYDFSEGSADMRLLLGGKGANLAQMWKIGLPVPPGFIITTAACHQYRKENDFKAGNWSDVAAAIGRVEKLTGKNFLCFVMSTLGLVLITGIGDTRGSDDLKGILFGLGAAVFYATVILLNKSIHQGEGIHRTFLQFLSAIVVLIPYVLSTNGITLSSLNAVGWVNLLIVGLVHTGVTYCLYFSSLKELPGQEAAILSYIDPLVAVLVSVTLLGESMTAMQVIGGALILGFTLLNELSPVPKAKKE